MTVIRERYVRQLETLQDDVLRMGKLVEQALQDIMQSLKTWDSKLAQQVVENDDAIDSMQREVEELAIRLLATQQPVASDLRLIGSVYSIVAELERIGDYAKHIARCLHISTSRACVVKPPEDLFTMASKARAMLHMSLETFLAQDGDAARQLSALDDEVDSLRDSLRSYLIDYMYGKERDCIETSLDLLEVVDALERVADRATNIGERVIYLETSATEELNP